MEMAESARRLLESSLGAAQPSTALREVPLPPELLEDYPVMALVSVEGHGAVMATMPELLRAGVPVERAKEWCLAVRALLWATRTTEPLRFVSEELPEVADRATRLCNAVILDRKRKRSPIATLDLRDLPGAARKLKRLRAELEGRL